MILSISTHAPLAGRDRSPGLATRSSSYFNPRAPCGARLSNAVVYRMLRNEFQPTRPLRGATDDRLRLGLDFGISTHAPLAGRDHRGLCPVSDQHDFNPRAPCGARPRGLTAPRPIRTYFNPRAPCGARRCSGARPRLRRLYFNPRAPCGARLGAVVQLSLQQIFQPTRPLRGATMAA